MRRMYLESGGNVVVLMLLFVVALVALRLLLRGKKGVVRAVLVLDVLFLFVLVAFFFDLRLASRSTQLVRPTADIHLDCSRSAVGYGGFFRQLATVGSNLAAVLEQRGYRPVLYAFGRYRRAGYPAAEERDSIAARSVFSPAWLTRERERTVPGSIALLLGDGLMPVPTLAAGVPTLPLYPVLVRSRTLNSKVAISGVTGKKEAGQSLQVSVRADCHRGGRLRLLHNGKSISTRPLPAGTSVLSFPFSPSRAGDHVLEAVIDIPGDGFTPDNRAAFHLRLQPRPLPVLLVTGRPDPEAGSLDRLLAATGRFRIVRYNPGGASRPSLRATIADAALLVLVHAGPVWQEADLDAIRNAVRRGLPLLYVNGVCSALPDRLAAVLPVVFPAGALFAGGRFPWRDQPEEAYRIAPLPEGLPGGDVFRHLYRGIRLRPGAMQLAEAGGTPVLSLGRYGKGPVAALFAGPVWDWDLGGAGYGLIFRHRENFFMGIVDQLLRTTSHAVALVPSHHQLLTGDTLVVTVQAAPGLRPALRLVREGDKPVILAMPDPVAQDGVFVSRLRIPRDGGWRLEYRTTGPWRESGRRILSGPDSAERTAWGQIPAPGRFALAGGRLLDPADPATYPPPVKPQRQQSYRVLPLTRSPGILVLLALLFLAGVFLRWKYPERKD